MKLIIFNVGNRYIKKIKYLAGKYRDIDQLLEVEDQCISKEQLLQEPTIILINLNVDH